MSADLQQDEKGYLIEDTIIIGTAVGSRHRHRHEKHTHHWGNQRPSPLSTLDAADIVALQVRSGRSQKILQIALSQLVLNV